MTLQQLRHIVTIVSYGSISDAAKQLFIAQPSLSNAVKELRKEMDIFIFDRSSKDTALSSQGMEFLSYARQVLKQAELLEQHYTNKRPVKHICPISIQHYALTVNAFANLVSRQSMDKYEFTLRKTRTYEIIGGVKNYRSELGILYIGGFNRKVLERLFKESGLVSHPLLRASSHVFISISHLLLTRRRITIEDLEDYPFLTSEQGEKNSFYFSGGILSTIPRKKIIYVSNRATLFNLLIGLNGYAICSGILNRNLNSDSVIAVPLETEGNMLIGWIVDPRIHLGQFARRYLEELNRLIDGQPQSKPRAKTPSAGVRIRTSG